MAYNPTKEGIEGTVAQKAAMPKERYHEENKRLLLTMRDAVRDIMFDAAWRPSLLFYVVTRLDEARQLCQTNFFYATKRENHNAVVAAHETVAGLEEKLRGLERERRELAAVVDKNGHAERLKEVNRSIRTYRNETIDALLTVHPTHVAIQSLCMNKRYALDEREEVILDTPIDARLPRKTMNAMRESLAKYAGAVNGLLELNSALVKSRAEIYTSMFVPMDERIDAGMQGLLRALATADMKRGKLSTYAIPHINVRIRGVVRAAGRIIGIPSGIQNEICYIARVEEELAQSLLRTPTEGDVIRELEARAATVRMAKNAREHINTILQMMGSKCMRYDQSLVKNYEDGKTESRWDRIRSREQGVPSYVLPLLDDVKDTFGALTGRQRRVLRLRYLDGGHRTYEEVGGILKRTRERVRQIEIEAIKRIHAVLARQTRKQLLDAELPVLMPLAKQHPVERE